MGYTYSVSITNHSSHSDYFMLFQNDPGSWSANAFAIAWFSKYSNPGPNVLVKFSWTVDYGFSWADTGALSPGILYDASDSRSSSPGNNLIRLGYNGAYFFYDQGAGPDPDRLYVGEDATVPTQATASVGITMSGSTVYATQARPNTNLTLSPHPSYYLAYGNFLPGEVIDVSTISNPLKLEYDTGVYALYTTLNKDDTWTPPTSAAMKNRRLLEARTRNPQARLSDV